MADNRETIYQRDVRIFTFRQHGTSIAEIAKRFDLSTAAVNAAIKRQLDRLNKEAIMAYPEVLRMELERLDQLQTAVWPLTQHRNQKLPDGSVITLEPDLKATAQVLNIMDRRMKLLGLEQSNININVEHEPVKASLHGATKSTEIDAYDPRAEVEALLRIMGTSRVLPQEQIDRILGTPLELEETTGEKPYPSLAELEQKFEEEDERNSEPTDAE